MALTSSSKQSLHYKTPITRHVPKVSLLFRKTPYMYEPHSQTQEDSALAYAPFILDPTLHDDSTQGLEIKYMDMLQQSDSLEMMLQSQVDLDDMISWDMI